MAMMMTGRVLLVCTLCVLWCGAGGRCEGEAAVLGSRAELPPAPAELATLPVGSQGLPHGVSGVKDKLSPASSIPREEDEEDDSDDDEDEETDENEKKITERQGDQGGTAAPDSDSREKNVSGSDQEMHQAIISAGDISPSNSQEPNANPTQPKTEKKKDSDENTPAAENPLTNVKGEQTLPESVVGVNPPPPPKDGVDSRKQDGEDTTSEGEKNVPSPETAVTPQSHRGEGSEGTGEDTKATTVIANTTDTTNKQSSDGSTVKMNDAAPQTAITPTAAQTNDTVTTGDGDGSTAVPHTTSPLLLLLLVACAAAAAVVTA
ncbi:mucin-associated surface protein [Trypanosoma cruzi cruzi]|nr:mucin-associated surface protein [Trypanosoma cruzi cruzi]PWV03330.1 Mucin-associated surface protein (MASP) [Trypanosoma cruzi]